MRKATKSYLSRVASLPCCVCGTSGVELHHVREGQGMAQRAQDWLVVPLCPDCHRGPQGLHGDRTLMRIYKLDEMDMLAKTIEAMNA